MDKGIFTDREKAMEANYFRQQDAKLLESLRKGAKLDEIALALRDKLQVDNPDLLARARALGVTADNVEAFFASPLVQVAWAEGKVSKREAEMVLLLARERGIKEESPSYAQLGDWLKQRPDDALFDTALEAIRNAFSVLPLKEREERIKRLLDNCHKVAEASGNEFAKQLGLGDGVSRVEESVLDTIHNKLRARD
jgi:hypothetical protein